ncbi:MAG: protein-tyrosine-phosphatase [Rhodoferax sp.]|nr:protein-tyrosine-phosphatase [Rhodoferax sp.]
MGRPLPQLPRPSRHHRWTPASLAARFTGARASAGASATVGDHVASVTAAADTVTSLAIAGRDPSWAEPVDASVNLFRVTPLFYRSARLDAADVPLLQRLGIATVVSLRSFHTDRRLLSRSGVRAVRIGINTWQIADSHIVAALQAIRHAERDGPVLLHCMHGADRTGLVAAMYRVVFQGWDTSRALAELTEGGYGYHTVWKNIPTYLARVNIEKLREAVLSGHRR